MKIIPKPNVLEKNNLLKWQPYSRYSYNNTQKELFVDFNEFLDKAKISGKDEIAVTITYDKKLKSEGYVLDIDDKGVRIVGGDENGVFYALQTLKQIILQSEGKETDAVHIKDAPLYSYRAFMLDVGRYFYPVEDVKHYIDMMAVLKLNVFHWHLTEDQGWRVEIKKYPLLTQKGSKRSHTNFGVIPHGGYYTQDQIKEIVEYCHKRFIKVVPEFDIPGHMVSAIACYPYLACHERKLKVATHWGVKHDVLCAGKESTYKFVYDVIDEMCELFTDGYFHIGGDEVVKMRWKLCPHCQAEIKRLGLKDENELQQVFMSNVNKYLNSKGYKSIIWNWDEINNIDYLDKNIIWQVCGTADNNFTCKQVNNGVNIVVSTCFANYLDFPYSWANLKMTYENKPEIVGVEEQNKKNILGLEGPLWTEYVKNKRKGDYLTFPRLIAIAEIAWIKEQDRAYDDFLDRLSTFEKMYEIYAIRAASVKKANPNKVEGFFTSLWFNRRMLHWQGLHNLIDDAIVAHKMKKKLK